MQDWYSALFTLQAPAVLVTIAAVNGSAPREVGTRMLVSATHCVDTIGGGALELQAIQQAQQALIKPAHWSMWTEVLRLGPECGQCCGGVVTLHYEYLPQAPHAAWQAACLPDLVKPPTWHVALFGAGHVGQAVAQILIMLPCQLHWLDSRQGQFPPAFDHRMPFVKTRYLAHPADYMSQLPAAADCLVMTHSHDLDFELCDHLLAREDLGFIGLIGSKTKASRFKQRLRRQGLTETQLDRLTSPIGLTGVGDKHPAAIAVAVVAQLLRRNASHSRDAQ